MRFQTLLLLSVLSLPSVAGEKLLLCHGASIDEYDASTTTWIRRIDHPIIQGVGRTFDGERVLAIDYAPMTIPNRLKAIHPADGSTVVVGSTGQTWGRYCVAHDPTTGKTYVSWGDELYLADRQTGALSFLGQVSGLNLHDCICAIAFDSGGRMVGVGAQGPSVYDLDPTSPSATYLGDLGFSSDVNDAAFDSQGDLWVSVSVIPGLDPVVKLDLANWTVTTMLVPAWKAIGVAFMPDGGEVTYCWPKVSSRGCSPSISSVGFASPTASSGFVVRASNVQNRSFGALFFSLAGSASTPFAGGTLCLAAPTRRTKGLVFSGGSAPPALDCSGSWEVDLNSRMFGKPAFTPGSFVHAQWMGRDPGFAAPDSISLSDGLSFVLRP